MKLTLDLHAPVDATGPQQIEIARQAAVDLLEEFERRWGRGFRKRAAKERDGRPWLFFRRGDTRDDLVVIAHECRARTLGSQLSEFQAVLVTLIHAFAQRYVEFGPTLLRLMREEKPLGLLVRRLLRFRPLGETSLSHPRPRLKLWQKYLHINSLRGPSA